MPGVQHAGRRVSRVAPRRARHSRRLDRKRPDALRIGLPSVPVPYAIDKRFKYTRRNVRVRAPSRSAWKSGAGLQQIAHKVARTSASSDGSLVEFRYDMPGYRGKEGYQSNPRI